VIVSVLRWLALYILLNNIKYCLYCFSILLNIAKLQTEVVKLRIEQFALQLGDLVGTPSTSWVKKTQLDLL
jgi:hypothetical protein